MESILERLEDDQIVSFEVSPDRSNIEVMECCDGYFTRKMGKEQLVKMIAELQVLADKMTDGSHYRR
uniref:Uncharacterized protein n=1 Tax=viral metagenome TaxID=1070528 RepID=A0A6M3JYC6_9ZZZZ